MPIVTSSQPGNFQVPGVFIVETPAPPIVPLGPPTSTLAVEGTADWGYINIPTYATPQNLSAQFGIDTTLAHSLLDAAYNGATPEVTQFLINRVDDGTSVASTVLMVDGSGFATGTLTVSGSYTGAQNISATLVNGSITVTTPTYAIQPADTVTTIAAQLVTLINNSAAVLGSNAFIQPVTNLAGVITVLALVSGTAGNTITIQGTITASGFSVSPTVATVLTGGATPGTLGTIASIHTGTRPNASSTAPQVVSGYRLDLVSGGTTSPIYSLTLYFPQQAAEIFNNIIGYATLGGGFSAATFKTNVATAINTGSTTRAPSQFWSWTSGSSTAAPLLKTYAGASGGTSGASGVTTSTLIGQDGTQGRTGWYTFRGMLSAMKLLISQLTDDTAAQALATFCQQENCISGIDLGVQGTSVATLISNKNSNNVSSRFLVASGGWCNYRDPVLGASKLCSPSSTVMATIASLDPWNSPLNKPTGGKGGILSTEWTTGQFPDETTLQTNNICYVAMKNGELVVWNDNCSDGTPVADTTMLNYIAWKIQAIAIPFLGQNQSLFANDPTRQAYFSAIKAFLKTLLDPNAPKINAASVDSSGSTTTAIQGGFMIGATNVTTIRGIRYILDMLQVGSQVVVSQSI